MKVISAGGVVYRQGDAGLELQLIRDRFGKITMAKGKMEPGETIVETALREIAEETGIAGRIVEPLTVVTYVVKASDREPFNKEAHYYLVEAVGGTTQAQIEEIAGVGWYNPIEAWKLQREHGYENNDETLRIALNKLGITV